MKNRDAWVRPTGSLLLTCLSQLCFSSAVLAQTPKILAEGAARPFSVGGSSRVSVLELDRLVREIAIDTHAFPTKLKLRDLLPLLHQVLKKKTGKDVGFLMPADVSAADDRSPDHPLNTTIKVVRREYPIALGTLLNESLSQVFEGERLFRIKKGFVELKPLPEQWRAATTRVGRQLVNGPLSAVCEELSEQAGVTIAIDPRVTEKAKTVVRAKFVDETTLKAALTLLADMAGLAYIEIENMQYITSVENVRWVGAK
jgi:hypothetical protein